MQLMDPHDRETTSGVCPETTKDQGSLHFAAATGNKYCSTHIDTQHVQKEQVSCTTMI